MARGLSGRQVLLGDRAVPPEGKRASNVLSVERFKGNNVEKVNFKCRIYNFFESEQMR